MKLERHDGVGILTIDTMHHNAINSEFIREAHHLMDEAERDDRIRALVVTSTHRSLFCPGADLPFLMTLPPPDIRAYFEAVTGLVRRKFVFPKPEVFALNGHTIAAGCMMALTGDYRIMVRGRSFIGLMEIDLGLPAHAGVVRMMHHVLGGRAAERVLHGGENYPPEKAVEIGLVDEIVESDGLLARAMEHARLLGDKPLLAYRALKRFSREAVVEQMRALDAAHVDELVTIWFAEETQRLLSAAVDRLVKKAPATPQA